MPRIIPEGWMPSCTMDRVVTHWTAGGHRATALDRGHYHILIEHDGQLVRGTHSIADNVNTRDGDYAAHTRGLNTRSIGVTMCCMLNAQAGSGGVGFKPGPHPMTQKQYEVMAQVVADLCERYDIDVKPRTVLGHGEVQRTLGIAQRGKWDPMVLPWDPAKPSAEVGDEFRARVKEFLSGTQPADPAVEELRPVEIQLNGVLLPETGLLREGASWCPLRVLSLKLGWTIRSINQSEAVIATPSGEHKVKALIRSSRGYVQVGDVAGKLGWTTHWDAANRTVEITI